MKNLDIKFSKDEHVKFGGLQIKAMWMGSLDSVFVIWSLLIVLQCSPFGRTLNLNETPPHLLSPLSPNNFNSLSLKAPSEELLAFNSKANGLEDKFGTLKLISVDEQHAKHLKKRLVGNILTL